MQLKLFEKETFRMVWFSILLSFFISGCKVEMIPSINKIEKRGGNEEKKEGMGVPKVGLEFPIFNSGTNEEAPSIAWTGTHYFLVWQDKRGGNFDIYGSRLTSSGKVLDPGGIPISIAPGDQIKPKFFWNGTHFFIVWQDKRNKKKWEIFGARLNAGGKVLDPQGIPISVGEYDQATPSISWDGENYFVVWEKKSPKPFGWDIVGTRVTPQGKVLNLNGVPIAEKPGDQYYSGISWNGKSYLVVWSDKGNGKGFDVFGARVTPNGVLLDKEGIGISQVDNDQFYPNVDWNGNVHLVVWMDKREGEGKIYGARVDSKGNVLDPRGIPIGASSNFHALPYVVSLKNEFLVVWEEVLKVTIKDILGARVNVDGKVLDEGAFEIYRGLERQKRAAAASDGVRTLVIWMDYREGIPYQGDIYGKFVEFSPVLRADENVIQEPRMGPFIIHQISFDSINPQTMYAATSHYGILKSEDGGKIWRLSNQGFESYTHHRVVVHPHDSQVLYAGGWGGGMSKSEDGGNTWQEINWGLGNTAINEVVLHPLNPDEIYVVSESGVFVSHNGGQRWRDFNKGLTKEFKESFNTLFIIPKSPYDIYLGGNRGLYQWDKQMQRWRPLRKGEEEKVTALAYHPITQDILLAIQGKGLLKSNNGGDSWKPLGNMSNVWISQIVFDPIHPKTLYIASPDQGFFKTIDGGENWGAHNSGLPNSNLKSLAIHPEKPGVLYAGTYDDGIFISRDGGQNWKMADSIPLMTLTEILNSIPQDQDMRFPGEVEKLIQSPQLAREAFKSIARGPVPPPEFAKCNGCHGWTDPLLNLKKTYWRVPPNIRDWTFTVKTRMGARAGLTLKEENQVIQFLEVYSRSLHGEKPVQVWKNLAGPTGFIPRPGSSRISPGPTLFMPYPGSSKGSVGPTGFIPRPGSSKGSPGPTGFMPSASAESPKTIIRRVCGQCHSLEINGSCLAGDCQKGRVQKTGGRLWSLVVDWMKSMGARMTPIEQRRITDYLNVHFPGKTYPLTWGKVTTLPGKGWNITSLHSVGHFLYAGTEGSGKIFRSSDGWNWNEVAQTDSYRVYGLTFFKGEIFAGTDSPQGEVWKSKNGKEWIKTASLPPDQQGIISIGTFKNFLYAGTTGAKIFRSSDGNQWEEVAVLREVDFHDWVRFIVEFKGNVYAGTEHGYIFRSSDGKNWKEIGGEVRKGRKVFGIRAAAAFKENLYIGSITHGEIWKTEDGSRWKLMFDSMPDQEGGYVGSMVEFKGNLYAGIRTSSGFVFRTVDGKKWEEVGNISPHSIEAMSVFKNHLYAGTLLPPNAAIYRAF